MESVTQAQLAKLQTALKKEGIKAHYTNGHFILRNKKREEVGRYYCLHDILYDYGLIGRPRTVTIEDLPEIAMFLHGGEANIVYHTN